MNLLLIALLFISGSAQAATEELRTLIRGGCLDEANCCFGKWKVKNAADIYQTDDAIDKNGALKAGDEVESTAGRVHTEPGKLKIVFKHGPWKAGQTIGIYSEPDRNGKVKIGDISRTEVEEMPFLKKGSKCAKPSADCWAIAESKPKIRWMIKIKLPEDRTGWVDAANLYTDAECTL